MDPQWTNDSAARVDPSGGRVLIVANRLPVTFVREGDWIDVRRSSGGLAAGLRGVRQRHRARWIGWTGLSEEPSRTLRSAIEQHSRLEGLIPVHLSSAEAAGFYCRYSNAVLWPALHGMPLAGSPDADWYTYHAVNARFADAVVRAIRPGDLVWVHDYHLMLVPRLVRRRVPWARIGFFLHTPFPEPESFARLPHASALLDGLLAADSIGVHTDEYAHNFLAAVRTVRDGVPSAGRSGDATPPSRVFVCPISVDVSALGAMATSAAVAREVDRLRGGRFLLGVDRLDYTKGIPHRLRAFERLLERDESVRGAVRFVQVAVPSREDVAGYERIRAELEATVRSINERWSLPGWQPVEYRYESIDLPTLVSLYRAADVMVVTPLRDGLNLVAKEFAAARVDDDGVLILSERAGAAAELRTALLIDPYDEEALAGAYVTALAMRPSERRVRMRHMRATIARHDVHCWAERALACIAGGDEAWSQTTHERVHAV